jgi:hypothetical protein
MTSDAFINDLLRTNPHDPANARYLIPLADPEQEEMAHRMADTIYSAEVEKFSDNITEEQADRVWEQCLIDARHMLCDKDYERIFTGE